MLEKAALVFRRELRQSIFCDFDSELSIKDIFIRRKLQSPFLGTFNNWILLHATVRFACIAVEEYGLLTQNQCRYIMKLVVARDFKHSSHSSFKTPKNSIAVSAFLST